MSRCSSLELGYWLPVDHCRASADCVRLPFRLDIAEVFHTASRHQQSQPRSLLTLGPASCWSSCRSERKRTAWRLSPGNMKRHHVGTKFYCSWNALMRFCACEWSQGSRDRRTSAYRHVILLFDIIVTIANPLRCSQHRRTASSTNNTFITAHPGSRIAHHDCRQEKQGKHQSVSHEYITDA